MRLQTGGNGLMRKLTSMLMVAALTFVLPFAGTAADTAADTATGTAAGEELLVELVVASEGELGGEHLRGVRIDPEVARSVYEGTRGQSARRCDHPIRMAEHEARPPRQDPFQASPSRVGQLETGCLRNRARAHRGKYLSYPWYLR